MACLFAKLLLRSRSNDDGGNQPRGHGGKHKLAVDIAPFIAAWRMVQMIAAVVRNDRAAVPVVHRHAVAPAPAVVARIGAVHTRRRRRMHRPRRRARYRRATRRTGWSLRPVRPLRTRWRLRSGRPLRPAAALLRRPLRRARPRRRVLRPVGRISLRRTLRNHGSSGQCRAQQSMGGRFVKKMHGSPPRLCGFFIGFAPESRCCPERRQIYPLIRASTSFISTGSFDSRIPQTIRSSTCA